MGKGWSLFFGLFLALSPPLFAQKPSLTFVASTADEALTFQAISKELAQRDIPHNIIAIGIANAVLHKNPRSFSLRTGCHVRAPLHKGSWPATQRLPEGDLMRVSTCLSPRVVVLGTHSRVQAQLVALFRKKNAQIIAFNDDFEPFSHQSIASSILPYAHHILLAHGAHKQSFTHVFPKASFLVTGNPKYEMWLSGDPSDVLSVRRAVIPAQFTNKTVMLYIQDKRSTPDDSLEELIAYVKQHPNIVGVFAPPPGESGAREKALIQMYDARNFVFLPQHVSLKNMARAADIILCHRTHTGIQAALAGLNVAYFDTQPNVYQNPLLKAGLIPLLKDTRALDAFIAARTPTPHTRRLLGESLGSHMGASARMTDFIVKQVEKSTPTVGFERLPWHVPSDLRIPF